jgi:hypothetical protein
VACATFICHFLLHGFCEFSRHERPAGSLPVCTAERMLQPLSVRLQNGLRFFQHPLPAIPTAPLAESPASARRDVGFTMFCSNNMNELAPVSRTGSLVRPCVPRPEEATDRVTFWWEPISVFGSGGLNDAIYSSLLLGLSFSLSLRPAWTLPASETSSRLSPPHTEVGMLSRQLLTRSLPISPVPIGYCGRNRRFIPCGSPHVEQLLEQLHFAQARPTSNWR